MGETFLKIVEIGHSKRSLIDCLTENKNFDRLYTVMYFKQACEIEIDDCKYYIKPHGVMVCKPCYLNNTGDDCSFDWFCICGDIEYLLKKYNLEKGVIYYPLNCEFASVIIRRLEAEMNTQNIFFEDVCKAYIKEFFVNLYRGVVLSDNINDIDNETKLKMKFLRQSIVLEYNKKWTISEMARLINFSPSYLHTVYKRVFGVSPVNDVIEVRINKGKALLLETQLSVNEIASNLGYMNTTHFIRQFTAKEGISPSKYRKRK